MVVFRTVSFHSDIEIDKGCADEFASGVVFGSYLRLLMADWEEGGEEKCYSGCSVGSKVVGFLAAQKVWKNDCLNYSYWILYDDLAGSLDPKRK